MKAILNIFRVLIGSIILLFFIFLLTLTPTVLTLSRIVTHRENVLVWLDKSQAYDQVSKLAVEKVKDELQTQGGLSKSEIKELEPKIKKTVSDTFVKSAVVSVVNGVYDWLEGKTKDIQVNFQQVDFKKSLVDLLPKEALKDQQFMQVLSALKPCTEAQALKYEKQGGFKSIDEFCIPPRLDLIKVADSAYDVNITNKTIKVDNIFQIPDLDPKIANQILTTFKLLQYSEWIMLGILVIFLVLFLLVSPTKSFKIYLASLIIIFNGIAGIILWKSNALSQYIPDLVYKSFNNGNTLISKELIQSITNVILNDITNYEVSYSIYIIFAGILLLGTGLIVSYFSNRNPKRAKR